MKKLQASIILLASGCLLTNYVRSNDLGNNDGSENRAAAASNSQGSAAGGQNELVLAQSRIADKYAKLENLLIRMAELEAGSNPQRSALLMKAAQQSKERLTRTQLNSIVTLLEQKQLKRAADGQQAVHNDLRALLDLLLSENRNDRLKNEQAKIREYIKEVERMIRLQRSLQGRTEGSGPLQDISVEQGKLAQRAGELARELEKDEQANKPASDTDPQQPNPNGQPKNDNENNDQPKDGQQKDGQPSRQEGTDKSEPKPKSGESSKDGSNPDSKNPDSKNSDSKKPDPKNPDPKDTDPKSQDGKNNDQENSDQKNSSGGNQEQASKPQPNPSPNSPPKDGGPMPPDGGASQPSNAPPSKEDATAKKRIAAAEDRMRAAQRKLEDAQRQDATQDQEKAKEELEKAKAELEEILRQMREEEVERILAMLEGRFRRMLESQVRIFESTKQLDETSEEQRDREFLVRSNRLSFDESRLVVEAERALQLLQEDASSLAFPESVQQVRDDMQQVADRLSTAKTDKITQGVEEEIISALEEMVAALQMAQQEKKDQKENRRQKPPSNQPTEPSLVDQLAELKMIRALQMRVNTRTQRFAKLLTDQEDVVGQALEAELIDALVQLAEREKRIHQLTRDLVLGKNK